MNKPILSTATSTKLRATCATPPPVKNTLKLPLHCMQEQITSIETITRDDNPISDQNRGGATIQPQI